MQTELTPAKVRLSAGLGIREFKELSNMLFKKNLVPIDVFAPLFGASIFMPHRRKLAIALPCLLVCGLVFGADKAAEQFNGSAMRQEFSLNMGVDVRPVMGSMVASNVDEGHGWGKGCSEGCARGTAFCDSGLLQCQFMLLSDQVQGKPVGHERAEQSAERSGKQLIGHGGYVSWEVLFFLGGLLGGSELMLLALRRNWVRMPNQS